MSARATGCTRDLVIFLDKLIYILARHWLFAANLAFVVYIGLPFLAPTLMANGYERWGRLIYRLYGPPVCHQLPERSYFLYGPRYYYTLEELHALVGEDMPARYIGDEKIGYKVAICERDVAIYTTGLMAGLAFAFVRRKLRPLPGRQFVRFTLIFVLPLAIDGTGQLLGFWESTWLRRSITGAIAAAGAIWLTYPYIEVGMQDVQQTIVKQLHLEREQRDSGAARDKDEDDQSQCAEEHQGKELV